MSIVTALHHKALQTTISKKKEKKQNILIKILWGGLKLCSVT